MVEDATQVCCGTCGCAKVSTESVAAMRYTLRQAADALRAEERDLCENMIHKTLEELSKYTDD